MFRRRATLEFCTTGTAHGSSWQRHGAPMGVAAQIMGHDVVGIHHHLHCPAGLSAGLIPGDVRLGRRMTMHSNLWTRPYYTQKIKMR